MGPSYTLQSVSADAQMTMNFYVEQDESGGGNSPLQLNPTPGLKLFAALGNPYDVFFNLNGALMVNKEYQLVTFTRPVFFPSNFSGSLGHSLVAPVVPQIVAVNKNGVQVGTITISNTGAFVFASNPTPITFATGDELTLKAPVSPDSAARWQLVLAGMRLN